MSAEMVRIENPPNYEPPTFELTVTDGIGYLVCSKCSAIVSSRDAHADWHYDQAARVTVTNALLCLLVPDLLTTADGQAEVAWAEKWRDAQP